MGKVKDLDTKEGREALFLNDAASEDELARLMSEIGNEVDNLRNETEKLCRMVDELSGKGVFEQESERKKIYIDPDPRKLFDPELLF
jgi:arsenate reductase-like glutaredoxin family protein